MNYTPEKEEERILSKEEVLKMAEDAGNKSKKVFRIPILLMCFGGVIAGLNTLNNSIFIGFAWIVCSVAFGWFWWNRP